jgi:hypothetical protein
VSDDLEQALLDAHRAHRRPSPGRADQTWSAIQGRIAAGGPGGGGATSVGKGWMLGVAAGGAVAVGVVAWLLAGSEPSQEVSEAATVRQTLSVKAEQEPQPTPVAKPLPAEPPAAIAIPERAPEESPRPAQARPRGPKPPSAPSAATDITEELALISSAKALLASGNARGALAKTAEHEKKFPRGSLVDERKLLRIRALCEDGQKELARKEAARFLRRKPGAAISARVREACP